MSVDLTPMWEKLSEYQPYAEKRGFGDDWKLMTTEQTKDAAYAAAGVAFRAGMEDAALAAGAAWAGADAVNELAAGYWFCQAITHVTRAIEWEQAL